MLEVFQHVAVPIGTPASDLNHSKGGRRVSCHGTLIFNGPQPCMTDSNDGRNVCLIWIVD
jgi:hypothetical protein